MKPKNSLKICLEPTSEILGMPVEDVATIVDEYYTCLRDELSNPTDVRVTVMGIGTLCVRKTTLENKIQKLKNFNNPKNKEKLDLFESLQAKLLKNKEYKAYKRSLSKEE